MKLTTLKHIETLAASVSLDLEDLFKFGLSEAKHWRYGLDQAIYSYTEGWYYWYSGILSDAVTNYGPDAREYLASKGLETGYINPHSSLCDADLLDTFNTDVARAYSDALRDAETSEFMKRVYADVERVIDKIGAPYACYLKLEGNQWVETKALYETEHIVFGFTRSWHKGVIDGLNDMYASLPASHYMHKARCEYDPDEIEAAADAALEDVKRSISLEYDLHACPSTKDVVDMFAEHNEVEHDLRRLKETWEWVSRRTIAMGMVNTGEMK